MKAFAIHTGTILEAVMANDAADAFAKAFTKIAERDGLIACEDLGRVTEVAEEGAPWGNHHFFPTEQTLVGLGFKLKPNKPVNA